jgi:hypothetical protein
MVMTRPISQRLKNRIIESYSSGLTTVEISKFLDVSQYVVSTTLMQYKHSECPEPEPGWNYCPWCGVSLKQSYWKRREET